MLKRLLRIIALLILFVVGLGLYANYTTPVLSDTGEETSPVKEVIEPTQELVAELQSTPTNGNTTVYVPLVEKAPEISPTPLETTEPAVVPTATIDPFEPTVNPSLLQGKEAAAAVVNAELLDFNNTLKYVIIESGVFEHPENVQGYVSTEDFSDVPLLEGLGPPCTEGAASKITGYLFNEAVSYGLHKGLDQICNNGLIGAPAKGKVYAIVTDNTENYKHLTSGGNVMTVSKLPPGFTHNGQDMEGYLLFGHGHMTYEFSVEVNDFVNAGDELGKVGLTGNTTGPHDHYYILWIKPDGSMEFLSPSEWGSIGTR